MQICTCTCTYFNILIIAVLSSYDSYYVFSTSSHIAATIIFIPFEIRHINMFAYSVHNAAVPFNDVSGLPGQMAFADPFEYLYDSIAHTCRFIAIASNSTKY